MFNRFLISVAAAALIAGTGFANAQGAGGAGKDSPAAGGGATTQHSAPSGGGAASGTMPTRYGRHEGFRAFHPGRILRDEGCGIRQGPVLPPGCTGQHQRSKGMSSENDAAKGSREGSKDMKAEGRDKTGNMKAEGRDRNNAR